MGGVRAIGNTIEAWFDNVYNTIDGFYVKMTKYWPLQHVIKLRYALLILFAVIIVVWVTVSLLTASRKKRKITYIVEGKVYATEKIKYRDKINYPKVNIEGKEFIAWFSNKKCTKKYAESNLNKKKNLKLFAKIQNKGADRLTVDKNIYYSEEDNNVTNAKVKGVVEEKLTSPAKAEDIGKLYDAIRNEMLNYERATPFKQLGVVRKQIIAEMFERDNVINLYLAIDPELMKEKGFSVTRYEEDEFSIVPCKKIVKTTEDYLEAVKLIKEAMLLNNFIKSQTQLVKNAVSDEKTRKNGFAFFVKNDVVATSSSDYYKLLRAIVLSYSLAPTKHLPKDLDNKMILKIFKKEEQIFLYLALDAEKEGLEYVGYDKNFVDTPSMFEVKVSENLMQANQLIDKLMYRFGMEKHPEQAELSADESINKNCGFGYRIRH